MWHFIFGKLSEAKALIIFWGLMQYVELYATAIYSHSLSPCQIPPDQCSPVEVQNIRDVVAAIEFHADGDPGCPPGGVDPNPLGDDGRVEVVANHIVAINIADEELQEVEWLFVELGIRTNFIFQHH